IVFADGTGTAGASGTQANPTDLNSAPGKFPGQNEIIVAQGNNGPLNVNNPVQLQDGQALLGGGTPVGVTLVGGPNNGHHLYFTPPGTRPTVVGNNAGIDLIQMASGSQNRVTGLNLAGGFSNGVAGLNMYRAIVTDNFISGGVGNGVFLQQSGAGAQPSSYVIVGRNTLLGNGGDGLRIENAVSDGLPHSQFAAIFNNLVSGNGADGIGIHSTATGAGTTFSSALYVVGNGVFDNAGNGLWVENRASDGGSVAQIFNVLAGNDVWDNGADGIRVENVASGAGAHVGQLVIVAANSVDGNGDEGIAVVNFASSGGTIDQTAAVGAVDIYGSTHGNVVTNNGYDGIRATNRASGGGASIGQTLTVLANLASGNGTGPGNSFFQNGILISNYGVSGGAVSQSISVLANSATGNTDNGIVMFQAVEGSSRIDQTGDISGNLASGNRWNGLYLYNRAGTTAAPGIGGGTIAQSLTGTSNSFVANGTDGVRLGNEARFGGSAISQSVALSDSVITGNSSNGVNLLNNATSGGALISQAVTIDPSIITSNGINGIYGFNAITSATLSQTIVILDNRISYNSRDGVRLIT
ncbi:MAG: right-handed parallel beta-helix repeat-containing protein, partial [Gemmataceae bacterium]